MAGPDAHRRAEEKRVEQHAPQLVSLVKTARLSLEKQGLQGLRAPVGLVLDASGSMGRQYKSGRVQELLDRVLPLALHFDDDGSLDVWAFDRTPKPLDPVTRDNIGDYINTVQGGWKRWYGGTNDEPRVIREVIDHYRYIYATNRYRLATYARLFPGEGVSPKARKQEKVRKCQTVTQPPESPVLRSHRPVQSVRLHQDPCIPP